jgi:transcription initiation factor TFIIIB Brf1 subunit/transcription initiation factor TFIIB
MTLKRGLPEGSRVRACPGCDEADAGRLVQIAAGRIVCERCGVIFDPQTGAVEPDPDEEVANDHDEP